MRLLQPLLVLVLSPLPLTTASLSAQEKPDSTVLLIARGRDTTQVEWSVREGNRLHVLAVSRAAAPLIRRYDIVLGADGAIEQMEVFDTSAPGADAERRPRARIYLQEDSTIEERLQGPVLRLATPGRTHVYNSSGTGVFLFSLLPPLAARAPTSVGESFIGQHVPGTLGPRPYVIRREDPEVVSMGSQRTGTMRVRFGQSGQVQEIDAMATSFNVVAHRVAWLDPDSVVRVLAKMERVRPQGPTAPRDSAVLRLGDAHIGVDYGRPSRRGRTIFGGIVPWYQVWRTGANLATHLTTSHALALGEVVVPAGQYTLWTLPTPEGWTLILNRETGQWGTDYEASYDVARLPMRLQVLPEPVEQFTIVLEPQDRGGVLRLLWDVTEASVSFTLPERSAEGMSQRGAARVPLPLPNEGIWTPPACPGI